MKMMNFSIFLLVFISMADASAILRRKTRVVGGQPVDINEYPYQVSVLVNGNHLCGGSIIDRYFIVTAAHCVDGETTDNVAVQAGVSTIVVEEGKITVSATKIYKVEKIYEHQDFSFWNYENDIAILKLRSRLPSKSTMKPIALPEATADLPIGQKATITGWGVTVERSRNFSTQLQAAEVEIISFDECTQDYPYDGITQRMVCAGDGQHDSCLGDSGGPLVVDDTLIGVVSWGYACGEVNRPGVYTSVIAVRDFIKDVTGL